MVVEPSGRRSYHRDPEKCPAGDPHYGDAIPTTALLSFRLDGTDGVSIEAAKWRGALGRLGHTTYTVAGSGPVDVVVPGLAIDDRGTPSARRLTAALARADLVVVENLLSLPLNQAAWDVAAGVLAGRPAVLHHHDLPWQRARFAGHAPPPDDPAWRHVTINERSRTELAEHGIAGRTVYNSFDVPPPRPAPAWPDRSDRGRLLREALGIGRTDRLVLQPTRALARKNVAGGLRSAAELGATYWLLGPAEDGYGPELERLVATAPCPVRRGLPDAPAAGGTWTVDDAYQACDVVTLPSTWEGFGNPSLESVTHRRPLVIGPYPVAVELAAFGFRWFALDAVTGLDDWLAHPDPGLLEANLEVARAHFSLEDLPGRIAEVLATL
jgi:glycosyltransferase involved in cell wall biosynthesis